MAAAFDNFFAEMLQARGRAVLAISARSGRSDRLPEG